MMADFMPYAMAVALIIGVAGLVLERVAAWRGLPRRGVWAAAMVASVTLPLLIALGPQRTARAPVVGSKSTASWPAEPVAVAARPTAATPTRAVAIDPPSLPRPSIWPARASLERLLRPLWWTASLGLVSFYAFLWLRLRFASRRWRREWLEGVEVCVTEELGPAVYGLLWPVVLVPQWVVDAPRVTRTVVLSHEKEHLAARDSWLLFLGLLLAVVAPRNPLLWWQLRRLRFAIEVDCDARVLKRGPEARSYGEVLLTIGQRRSLTPVGAIALTEPASQLRRRIRIMTARLPRRSNWLVGAAIGLSVACVAGAVGIKAPPILPSPVAGMSADSLRKPPPVEDPRPAAIERLVRATYPDLFNAAAPAGPVLVTLLLDKDGSLHRSFKEDIEPTPWIANSLRAFEAMGVDFEHRGTGVKLRMPGSPSARNHVDVRAWYLAPATDPGRDVAVVRTKVKERHGSLLSAASNDEPKLVTVFMTETGAIEREKLELARGVDLQTLVTPEHFVALGVAPERIGRIGATVLSTAHFTDEANATTLQVIYAWPRRAGEHASTREPPEQTAAVAPNDGPAVDRLIAEHHFPDLYSYPTDWPRADPWVLLDRQGRVLKAGRRVVMSGRDIQLYVESLFPGIRTDGVQVATVHGADGRWADVGFVWLAADSPVTEPSRADLAKRRDLLLYADVVGEGKTRSSEMLVLDIGSAGVTVCALNNPFGVVHLEVTAVEGAADAVALSVRIQHAPLGTRDEIPAAVESAWSAQSSPMRVPFGGSVEVEVADQNHKLWTIVLHPERLNGARG